jgi:hypothetical protein
MYDSVKRYHFRKVLIHWAGISIGGRIKSYYVPFEMRLRLKLSFLFNCLEMEAQAPTRSTTFERAKNLGGCFFAEFFSSTRKSSYSVILFSVAVSKRGGEGFVGCSMGKNDYCISCR